MENAGIFKKKIYQHNYLKFLINLLRMKKYKPSIINIGNTIPFRPDKKKSSFNRFRNIENVSIQHGNIVFKRM